MKKSLSTSFKISNVSFACEVSFVEYYVTFNICYTTLKCDTYITVSISL